MRRFLALFIALTILSAPAVSQTNPAPSTPTEYYGNVTYDNGEQVQGDVLAVVGSNVKSQTSIENGFYEMIVEKKDDESFSEVEFVIDTGEEKIATGTTAEFRAFKSQEVDLQIPAPEETDSSSTTTFSGSTSTTGENEQPVAGFTWETPVRPDETVTFDASGSFDPDGNISEYRWSFGNTGVTAENVFGSTGSYEVTLTIVDDDGAETNVTKDVSVRENQEPVPRFTITYTDPNPLETVEFNASESYDVDGSIEHYEWSFGDSGSYIEQSFDEGTNVTLTVIDNEGESSELTKSLEVSSEEDDGTDSDGSTITGSFFQTSGVIDSIAGVFRTLFSFLPF